MRVLKFGEMMVENVSGTGNGAILFTDVVGSSARWSSDPNTMKIQLDKHFELVNNIATRHDGFVVKTIGDAFMIYFNPGGKSLLNAIKCGIEIINGEDLPLRIGVCAGQMEEKSYVLQNSRLRDFFGNTVNTASRMESKVAEAGGIAFSYTEPISDSQSTEIKQLVDAYNPKAIKYSNDCSNDKELQGKRSGRLLTDINIELCKSSQELKGVKDITAYSIKIK